MRWILKKNPKNHLRQSFRPFHFWSTTCPKYVGKDTSAQDICAKLARYTKKVLSWIFQTIVKTWIYIFFKVLEESQEFKSIDMSENCIFLCNFKVALHVKYLPYIYKYILYILYCRRHASIGTFWALIITTYLPISRSDIFLFTFALSINSFSALRFGRIQSI